MKIIFWTKFYFINRVLTFRVNDHLDVLTMWKSNILKGIQLLKLDSLLANWPFMISRTICRSVGILLSNIVNKNEPVIQMLRDRGLSGVGID